MLCDMLNVLKNIDRRLGDLRRTNVRWVVPQPIGIALVALVVVLLPALACGSVEFQGRDDWYDADYAECEDQLIKEFGVAENIPRKRDDNGETTDEWNAHVDKVAAKYEDLFRRQPNVWSYGGAVLLDPNTGDYGDEIGISVWVTKKVDQRTLPAEDRIPDCLEGVPVQFWEGANTSDFLMPGLRPVKEDSNGSD